MLDKKFKKARFEEIALMLCMMFPLVPLEGLFYISKPLYYLLYGAATVGVFGVASVLGAYKISKDERIGYATIALILFAALNISLTIIKNGDVRKVLVVWMYTIILALFTEYYRDKIYLIIKTMLFLLEAGLLGNLMLMLLFPRGMYSGPSAEGYGKMWLLGYKSSLQCFVLPALYLALLLAVYEKKKIHLLLLLAVSHVECVLASNGMLLAIVVILDIGLLLHLYKADIASRKTIILAVAGIILANILVVFLTEKFLSLSFVQYVVVKILGKDATLSMRTVNWKAVTKAIIRQPLTGYGYTSALTRSIMYGRNTAHAHNMILELLYEGGILQAVAFIIFNCVVFRKLVRNRKLPTARISSFFILLFYIMCIFENPFQKSYETVWFIFIAAYYCRQIDARFRSEQRKQAP